ncbi:hypothetical protein SDC9_96643 [bioreactor metagenome]|uniref:Uncharacterized protein n=1 Tax=bioreactor metagenome TaxID=1076179 RepID=A0A645A9N9_9ZZZZ
MGRFTAVAREHDGLFNAERPELGDSGFGVRLYLVADCDAAGIYAVHGNMHRASFIRFKPVFAHQPRGAGEHAPAVHKRRYA